MLHDYTYEHSDVFVFLTLILLEGVLSFDNAAILAAMVRKLPPEMRRKALLYGLVGAYTFRTLAIFSVAFIIRYPLLKVVGGLYLIFLAVKHLGFDKPHEAHGEGLLARVGVRGFWTTVALIELADLAFALDQILVAVALTEETLLIVAAALVAILFLRISAIYIVRLMDWFPALEKLAYVAVGWVGLKLLAVEAAHYLGYEEFEVNKWISVGVTFSVLVVPVLVKFIAERVRVRPGQVP